MKEAWPALPGSGTVAREPGVRSVLSEPVSPTIDEYYAPTDAQWPVAAVQVADGVAKRAELARVEDHRAPHILNDQADYLVRAVTGAPNACTH